MVKAATRTNIQPEYRSVGRIFHDAESHDRNDCNNARIEHHQIQFQTIFYHVRIVSRSMLDLLTIHDYTFAPHLLYIIYIIGRY